MEKKIVLAYSGGLDTSTIIPWLKENYNAQVIAVCVNVGQGELDELEQNALSYGASKCIICNATEEFVDGYVSYILKAGAKYENKYMLGTSIARPIITEKLVEIALAEKAYAICHGATGKGNDQVRFELAIMALAPELSIIAPWRKWDIESREDAFEYLESRGHYVPMKREQSYSRDANIWHVSTEGLELEDPSFGPNLEDILTITKTIEKANETPTEISLHFKDGIPVCLNNKSLSFTQILTELNKIGGENGIGISDIVENRVVGMKSRGVYETPGGTILYFAHECMESLTLDKETISFKTVATQKFAELIYSGMWHHPLTTSLCSFIDATQNVVEGEIKLKLYKGNIQNLGMKSKYSLYNKQLASFTIGDLYDQKDAEGFIKLFGLPLLVNGITQQKLK